MQRRHRASRYRAPVVVSSLAALVLGACAAAMPGYMPEPVKKNAFERAKPFESGEVAASGAYVVSDAERALDCKKIKGSMLILIAKLRDTGKGPAASAASQAAQSAVAQVRGRALIMEPTAEAKRERARLEAYNGLLAEKKCPVMDLQAELAGAPAAPPAATPAAKPPGR